MKPHFRLAGLATALLLAGCASHPPAPDWQLESQGAMQRAVAAYFAGDARVEALEFTRARRAVASTGQPDQAARAELLRCAARVAATVFEPCAGFEPLRPDASPPERAYADYLDGHLPPAQAGLLPEAQRAVGALPATADPTTALRGIADPLARLVAAGVLLRQGRVAPGVAALAVESASAQGWRRPLLAWLGVQVRAAETAGEAAEAARLKRRMDLVGADLKP